MAIFFILFFLLSVVIGRFTSEDDVVTKNESDTVLVKKKQPGKMVPIQSPTQQNGYIDTIVDTIFVKDSEMKGPSRISIQDTILNPRSFDSSGKLDVEIDWYQFI